MSQFLRHLALAHQHHEGYYKGSLAYRCNNPGNLRGPDGNFRVFNSYEAGLAALEADLMAKITGSAGSIHRFSAASGIPYEHLTFQDYVSIYAPTGDGNDPIGYADALCKDLAIYNVQPGTLLPVLALLARGQIQRAVDRTFPPSQLSSEQRVKAVENALRFASPERASVLRRLLARLYHLVHFSLH
ncbi:hypothetical protein KW797_00290, partial [Candidatus Parcubacteria bacterium]|nr:hypothetical protein [Candidatus Parcubacteria bacterium]